MARLAPHVKRSIHLRRSTYRALLVAISRARLAVAADAEIERFEHRRGMARKAEDALERARRLLNLDVNGDPR